MFDKKTITPEEFLQKLTELLYLHAEATTTGGYLSGHRALTELKIRAERKKEAK